MRTASRIAIFLILLSLGTLLYRIIILGHSFVERRVSPLWKVTFRMRFEGTGKDAEIGLILAQNSLGQRIYEERIQENGFQFHIKGIEIGNNRRGRWKRGKLTGRKVLAYEVSAKVDQGPPLGEQTTEDQEDLQEWLEPPEGEFKGIKICELSQKITNGIGDEKEKADILCRHVRDNVKGSSSEKARLLCALFRAIGIPSRIVGGLILEEGIQRDIRLCVEAYLGDTWSRFCPDREHPPEASLKYLTLYRGNLPLVRKKGVKNFTYLITIERERRRLFELIGRLDGQEEVLPDLSSLPLPIQRQVQILLVIPLGALIVVIFRSFVGLNTFGTFTPLLMALAFRETKLLWGLLLFSFVIAIGCFSRTILDQLKLLFISRASIILTLVITIMTIFISVGYHTGLWRLSSVVLFPVVIMTMVIERFSIAQIETGLKASLILSLQTLIVACAAYLLVASLTAQLTIFFFPELILTIIGILILLGRYTGPRVTELWRFRSIGR